MDIMANIAAHSASPDEVLLYANKLLVVATKLDNPAHVISAYHYKGVAYRLKGNLKAALADLFYSATLASNNKEYVLQAEAYDEVANTYAANNDLSNALLYNKKAITILRVHGAKQQLAINLLNTGYIYYQLNELDSALVLFDEAEPLFTAIGLPIGKAYTVGNRALVYWKQGNYFQAEKGLLSAIGLLRTLGDQFGMADYYNQLGRLYFEQGRNREAIQYSQKSHAIALTLNLKEQIRDASLLLSQVFKTDGDYQRALRYQSQYLLYKDSIENSETTKQIADLRTEFEVSLKDKEIVVLEKRQLLHQIYIGIVIVFLGFTVLLLLYFRQRFRNSRFITESQKKEHDEKINNLLSLQETKVLQSMVEGQENERKRLAQELHNHFGSLLATVKVNLNAIDEKAISNHHTLVTLVDKACTDIRNLSHELNLGISADFGLVPALQELTTHLQHVNGLEVEFSATMSQYPISFQNELIVYRIVQELVSNVLKHAEASKLAILLTYFEQESMINILVQDNGKGFDLEKVTRTNPGMGLKALLQMVLNLKGEIFFDSNPLGGTTVNIDLPLIN